MAVDLDYEIGVAVKRQDNIALTASGRDPISETVVSPRAYFEARQDGPRLRFVGQGALEYFDYLDDTFSDETRARFNGQLDIVAIPDRLEFVFRDYLSQQPVDPLAAYAPDNTQQINVFVAGPTLKARFGPAMRGQLDLRYADNHAEESESFNGNRYSAAARLARDLSPTREMSVNLAVVDADFDQSGDLRDYRRYEGFVNLTSRHARMETDIDLGHSRVELDGSGREDSTALVRASLEWELSPRSLIGLSVRQQFTDSGEDMTRPLELEEIRFNDFNVPYLVEPSVFEERQLRGRYRYRGDRLSLQAIPYARRVRYLDATLEDENRRGVIVSASYRLRPRLTATFYALRENREFVDIDREDDDFTYSIGLANRFTRHWTGRIDFLHQERDSNVDRRSFDSNAVLVSLSYRR
ncbi:outer membrane beta-barrel protein [Marilutibacter chinensis]|uniref:Outer membrane beta-barrel protein n=1 Tax=Marilutibacter chinensis TaxID=2912247 RepID=A0ABS9HPR4_9GAMM|nr:outer membrane beta-barrel protein [Lysobacter chinensis]MCF7220934.1 outer membrane beta-barrel protein [Lysobacter chinensis]